MESPVCLFAGDTIVYLAVSTIQDAEILQIDLENAWYFEKKMAHGISLREMPTPYNNQEVETCSTQLHAA